MLIISSLSPLLVSLPSNSSELLLSSITHRKHRLFIGTFYRPPSSTMAISSLLSLLSNFSSSILSNLILVGDFNVNYVSSSSSPFFLELKSFADSYSLSQVISDPTHFSHAGTPSIIDLAFIPSTFTSNYLILPPLSSSDHNAILLSVFLPFSFFRPYKPSRRRIWLYNKADINAINTFLSSIPWNSVLTSDLDSSWLTFKSLFLQVMKICIPSKLLPHSPLPPWINRSLLSKIRLRQRLFLKAKSSSSPTLIRSYRSLRNSISSTLKKSKASFFRSLSHSSPSKFWSFVKSLRRSSSSIPPLCSNGLCFQSDSHKANCLNSFFISCLNKSALPLNPIPPSTPSFPCPSSFLCSESVIISLISHLPSKTASGPDGISSWMLKSTSSSIASPLCHIFNLSISSGLVPLDWKSSFVVPIPKSAPTSSSPSNYRPISLLSLVSKLLEKHIHTLLYDFCISNNLISPFQFGFLPYRSTISALLYSTHTIFSLLESYSSVCGAFLDLHKAFDSVPHQPLLDLLASSNLPLPLLNWLHSYLLNRTQCVVVNGSSSSSLLVSSGVPQGSILGPLLFLIYVNGLTDLPFSPLTRLILYADDIFIFKPISSSVDMSSFQSDLDSISSWLSSHFLQINSSKSKYIFFSHKPFSYFDSFSKLTISQSPIERVSSFRYLGIILSSSLSWSPHISFVLNKSRKILGLLFRHFSPHSSPSTLIRLYISLVRPILEYGSIIWDPSSPTLSHSLDSVQLFALKIASKFRSSLIPIILSEFNLPSLASRRQKAKLIFLFKLYHHFIYFPSQIIYPSLPLSSYPLRSFNPNNFICSFIRKSSFYNSYLPSTVRYWNSLPSPLKETNSLSLFISLLSKL